ncbi:MAG: endopeptidase La [Myxococcota bacterium]
MTDSLFPADPTPTLPLLPLRNSVLFPASVVPVNVGRPRSVRLVEEVVGEGAPRPLISVVAQKKPETEDPTFQDVHTFGTIARILKVIRLSSGNYSVVLQGVSRMRVIEPLGRHPCMKARIERIHEAPLSDVELDALAAHLRERARELAAHLPNQPRDASAILENVGEPGALADLVASNLPVGNGAKQDVLETLELRSRLRKVLDLVNRQGEVYRVKKEISTMVQEEMSRSQREYLLRQQLRQIKRELGEPEDDEDEIEALREKVVLGDLPAEAERAAKKQLGRMRTMNAASSEFHVARTYVEWLTEIPWNKTSADRLDVPEARRVLDEDHHGLDKPKKRILEYIAVRKLRHSVRGPILCFVGPPGVGKTSLARSIARATGRSFVRVALGGVQDEAEIRGHRRTYVGAFPGRIVSALKKAGSRNPVVLLDEVDKLGADHRGDPASALLEVLDPEQNHTFGDHYIEVPVDLSSCMFIATANRKDTIPGPLLDRMEVIDLPGYTQEEKRSIARGFLVPRQLEEHGLTVERLDLTDPAVDRLIDEYTREAGVRRLEQQVAALCRSVAVRLAHGEDVTQVGTPAWVEEVLGAPRYRREPLERKAQAGVSTGLAWTPAGGDVLHVEARRMPGSGKLVMTGRMGDVMKESVHAAFTYLRARAGDFGLPEDFLEEIDVHVHLPDGAVPKDGASAGLPILTAMASTFTRLRVRPDVATSGEITLRGSMLRVTGIKERCLAAHRNGIRIVVLPKRNEPDLDDVPREILDDLKVHLVSRIEDALPLLLEGDPLAPATAAV